jgi:hypothetical protein
MLLQAGRPSSPEPQAPARLKLDTGTRLRLRYSRWNRAEVHAEGISESFSL